MFNAALPKIPLSNEQSLLNQMDLLLSASDYDHERSLQLIDQYQDCDIKTAICYQYISNKHQSFINKMNSQSLQVEKSRNPRYFIIIPALLHEKYPALGGDGRLFADIARCFGHQVEMLDVGSGRSQQDIISNLSERILCCKDKKPCLVGISRGAADIVAYLKENGPGHIEMIINVAGIIKGTPLSSYMMATRWRRLKYRLIAAYCGVDFCVISDLSCENDVFNDVNETVKGVRIINFIGVPLKSHVQPHLIRRYHSLAKIGPNDGMIFLKDYLAFPGDTYPIWGGDHFFRLPGYSRILYQLFNLLEERTSV